MAKKSKSTIKVIGLALIVIGVGLEFWGYQMSGSAESKLTQVITGSDTNKVMAMYIGGIASLVVGLYLFIKR